MNTIQHIKQKLFIVIDYACEEHEFTNVNDAIKFVIEQTKMHCDEFNEQYESTYFVSKNYRDTRGFELNEQNIMNAFQQNDIVEIASKLQNEQFNFHDTKNDYMIFTNCDCEMCTL